MVLLLGNSRRVTTVAAVLGWACLVGMAAAVRSSHHDLFDGTKSRLRRKKKHKTPSPILPTPGFLERRDDFLQSCAARDGFYNTICRVSRGLSTTDNDQADIQDELTNINNRVGTTLDFRVNALLRMLYLDDKQETPSLSMNLKTQIQDALLGFRYWFTDPQTVPDVNIFWTENHLIVYQTSELLAGQLFSTETFAVSGLTGAQHVERVLPNLEDWLDKRGRFGFAEWHSNPYAGIVIAALVNLVDFAAQPEISTKAAMVLDLIGFNFANHYYRGLYATAMGRTEDVRRVTTSPRQIERVTNSAYLMLGLPDMFAQGLTDMGSIAIATSRHYAPPPILESIAVEASECHEHYEQNSIQVDQGELYGIGYDPTDINDIMFWWAMSAPVAGPVVEATLALIQQFNIDPQLIVNDSQFLGLLQFGAANSGVSLSEYCSTTAAYLVRGPALETSNIYTYRTPHYQLSGAQDRNNKGLTSLQEHAWQATLDTSTYVFANSPSQLSEEFIGGWMPRVTLYKNVGVFQYDRDPGDPFLNASLEAVGGVKDYLHAYFPRSQFDEWYTEETIDGTYLFGKKGASYVSLFSKNSGIWQSDFEWRVQGQKNVFVIELGSAPENGSFTQFRQCISNAMISISDLSEGGYGVSYHSPSVGLLNVAWEGTMTIEGNAIDLGPYARYDNAFCHQEFASQVTEIEYKKDLLRLDFASGERAYFGSNADTEGSKDSSSDDEESHSSSEDTSDSSSD